MNKKMLIGMLVAFGMCLNATGCSSSNISKTPNKDITTALSTIKTPSGNNNGTNTNTNNKTDTNQENPNSTTGISESTKTPNKSTITTNHSSNKTGVDANVEPYYGNWVVKKELAHIKVTPFSNEDILKIIGRKIVLTDKIATSFGDNIKYLDQMMKKPLYGIFVLDKKEFARNNNDFVTFEQIGLKKLYKISEI